MLVFAFLHPDVTGIKQVVRVKIRSSQDMNDPAVKAAILDEVGLSCPGTHLQFLFSLLHQEPDSSSSPDT